MAAEGDFEDGPGQPRDPKRDTLEELLDVDNPRPWSLSACPVCGATVAADFRDRHTAWHLHHLI